jgi:hypothetical protein
MNKKAKFAILNHLVILASTALLANIFLWLCLSSVETHEIFLLWL